MLLLFLQCKERIAIIFDHRLNVHKSKEAFKVEFVGSAGSVQVSAVLANSSTLILETPGKWLVQFYV